MDWKQLPKLPASFEIIADSCSMAADIGQGVRTAVSSRPLFGNTLHYFEGLNRPANARSAGEEDLPSHKANCPSGTTHLCSASRHTLRG